ncbi:MAG: hypothetical protein ACSLFQ_17510 [Thermoanaerobaculia bacterium]
MKLAALTLTIAFGSGFALDAFSQGTSLAAPVSPPAKSSAARKESVKKLGTSLAAVKPGSSQTESIRKGLMSLAPAGSNPDSQLATTLASSLATALQGAKLSPGGTSDLAKRLDVVMNASSMSSAEVDKAIQGATSALKSSGAGDKAAQVGDALRAMASSLR